MVLAVTQTFFYKQLKHYKRQFNVVTIELPGHGNSPDINTYKNGFTSEIAASEVIETLDFLKIGQAHLLEYH